VDIGIDPLKLVGPWIGQLEVYIESYEIESVPLMQCVLQLICCIVFETPPW
jgi:hypothetical protein